jgi:hypothetical protein
MSYTYLQEQGEESSVDSFSDIPQSVLSRLSLTAGRCFSNDNETDTCPSSLSGMTYGRLEGHPGGESLTSCAEDSLVKTSPQQGQEERESQALNPPSGLKCSESFLKSSRKKYSSKTATTSEPRDLDLSSKDFPTQGMMLRGVCYPLATVVPTTKGNGCGYSGEKLPTPTAHNAKEGGYPAEGTRNTPTLGWVVGGKIHPCFTEWMMGWPIGWTDLKPLETDKFQSWLQQHTVS